MELVADFDDDVAHSFLDGAPGTLSLPLSLSLPSLFFCFSSSTHTLSFYLAFSVSLSLSLSLSLSASVRGRWCVDKAGSEGADLSTWRIRDAGADEHALTQAHVSTG